MTPVDRFKEWAASDKGKAYFRGKISDPLWIGRFGSEKLCREWITAQYVIMCDWLSDNPKKGNKRLWASFTGRWLRKGLNDMAKEAAKALNPGLMTVQQEQDYYNKPREKTFVKVGDILSGKAQKENS